MLNKSTMDTPEEIPELLDQLGKFFLRSLENLHKYFHNPGDWEIDLPYVNKVGIHTLSQYFRMFWELQGWSPNATVIISIYGSKVTCFKLTIASGQIASFSKIANRELIAHNEEMLADTYSLHVHLSPLIAAAKSGRTSLLLCLLRDDGIKISPTDFIWRKAVHRIRISPDSLELVGRWFFPFSGMGAIIWTGEHALPLIFYGGALANLRLLKVELVEPHLRATFTQQFRSRHRLALVLSITAAQLQKYLNGCGGLLEFLSLYGKSWFLSIPVEIHDFIVHFPKFVQFLPGKAVRQKCAVDGPHLYELCRLYLENGWKYLKRSPVYLLLKDNEQSLLFEITHEGIYEIVDRQEIPPENLFTVDIEIFATMMAWFNDNSLRLITRFIDSIVPAEISEKIAREEIFIYMTAHDTQEECLEIFICGGTHNLPGYWQGDFSLAIVDSRKRRVIYSELLPDASLVVIPQGSGYRLHFPVGSCLMGQSLSFTPSTEGKTAYGIARLISDTSIVAEIAPGLRTSVAMGNSSQHLTISVQEHDYRVTCDNLLWCKTQGRILKHHGNVKHVFHTWFTKDRGGIITSGIPSSQQQLPPWWTDFILSTERGAMVVSSQRVDHYEPEDCYLPCKVAENKIQTQWKSVGWKQNKAKIFMRFWALDASVAPFDKRGNFIIRVRALVEVEKQKGFALLELPCRLWQIEHDKALPVEIKVHKQAVIFCLEQTEIFRIDSGYYLRLLKNVVQRGNLS